MDGSVAVGACVELLDVVPCGGGGEGFSCAKAQVTDATPSAATSADCRYRFMSFSSAALGRLAALASAADNQSGMPPKDMWDRSYAAAGSAG